jgi:peptide/nickel transport system substrate-binding protein
MLKNKLFIVIASIAILSMVLSACAPQTLIETVVVTQVVEKEGQKVVETMIVEVTPVPTEEPSGETFSKVTPEFKNPDTLTVISGAGEPESLDPAWLYDTASSGVAQNIYEGLVFFKRERTDEFAPALATEWSVSEDEKVWTFTIREGVKFHGGGTLEPHDAAYTFQRALLQGRIDGPHWMTYEALLGPELAMASVKDMAAAFNGKETFEELGPQELVAVCEEIKSRIVADDDAGTLTLTLNQPVPWILALMSQTFLGSIVDKEWMIENGDWDDDCATWQNWADPAAEETILFDQANGTGPYMLESWTPGEEVILNAFPDYWQTEPMWEGAPTGPASIQRVVIKDIAEWGTRLAMLEAGDADWIYVPAAYRSQLEPYAKTFCDAEGNCEESNPDGYVLAYRSLPQPAITPAQLNWNINVEGGNPFIGSGLLDGSGIPADFFNDIHIRKAFNYCFDYQAMIDDALQGDGVLAQGPIPEGMLGYIEGEPPAFNYDPDKCVEEFKLADLDKDGIPAGEDDDDVWNLGFYFQVAYNTGNATREIASDILKASIEAVNPAFSIAVVGMPFPVFLESRRQGKLPIYVGGWQEDYHDPHNWVHAFLHSQGAFGRVINMPPELGEQFDGKIADGASLSDLEQRRPIYEEIQHMAQENVVNVWLYQQLERYHFQEWVKGFYYNPGYTQPYAWIYALSKEAP